MSIGTFKEAQEAVKDFADRNGWEDVPNIDKFDHLHEELIEISQHLRYKTTEEMVAYIAENKEIFVGEMGDMIFGLCRLANQLSVDLEEGFNLTNEKVAKKYDNTGTENKIVS